MPSQDFLDLNPGFVVQPKTKSKYGNHKVIIDGITFDSKAEARRYNELKYLVQRGHITDLIVHPVFELQAGFTDALGRRHRAIGYEGDFQYTEAGKTVVEDVKGVKTDIFKLKEKLFRFRYPDILFSLIKA